MTDEKGLTGLQNLGNTCFLNSCMQVISNSGQIELKSQFNKIDITSKQKHKSDYLLLKEWLDLQGLMWSKNCIISPARFVKTVQEVAKQKGKDIFTGNAQNDLPEFLLFILDTFHNALSTPVKININGRERNNTDKIASKCYSMIKRMYEHDYSVIIEQFSGIHVSYISEFNDKSKVLSCSPDPFLTLDLPVPNKNTVSIYDCFDEYCITEPLTGENMWYNDVKKEKQDAVRTLLFWKLPETLIITLKRFNSNARKISKHINIPLDDINLSKYIVGYNKSSYVYEVYGVCNQSGSVFGGHYTANIKKQSGKWYNYNDVTIKEITESKVITPEAYCLFLKKKHS